MSPSTLALALSCRDAWIAAEYGDRDPEVLRLARIYEKALSR